MLDSSEGTGQGSKAKGALESRGHLRQSRGHLRERLREFLDAHLRRTARPLASVAKRALASVTFVFGRCIPSDDHQKHPFLLAHGLPGGMSVSVRWSFFLCVMLLGCDQVSSEAVSQVSLLRAHTHG